MTSSSPSAPTSRDLLSVDLRGMKPALIERARDEGASVSGLVRGALSAMLRDGIVPQASAPIPRDMRSHSGRVRVSLRLSRHERDDLRSRATAAGLPLGIYVAALMRHAVEPPSATYRAERTAALMRSNAELSTLSRNIARLTALLRQGAVREAQVYRRSLDVLDADVRAHLALAADVLAHERPPTSRA